MVSLQFEPRFLKARRKEEK